MGKQERKEKMQKILKKKEEDQENEKRREREEAGVQTTGETSSCLNFRWRRSSEFAPTPLESVKKESECLFWCDQMSSIIRKIRGASGDAETASTEKMIQRMNECLRDTIHQATTLDDQQQLIEYQQFLLHHPYVIQMKEDWLLDSLKGSVGFGYKVGAKKRWGPDDVLYQRYPELQALVPRGLVLLKRHEDSKLELVLFSNRKFFGRKNGDDDDCDLTSQTLRKPGSFKYFLLSEKANGESAQISLLRDGETLIIGSKNRKIAARNNFDLSIYQKEQKYSYALEIASTFFEVYVKQMGKEKFQQFKQFLQLTRCTVNFEFESPLHQHIVELKTPRLVLINLTGIHLKGTACYPPLTLAFARYFSIPCVLDSVMSSDYVPIPQGLPSIIEQSTLTFYQASQLDELCLQVARGWEREGCVMILLDSDMNVVDLLKVKCWWYILLRAVREKVRALKRKDSSIVTVHSRIKNRLKELEGSMNIPKSVIAKFIELGCGLASYINDNDLLERFSEEFPTIWYKFLRSSDLPTDSSLICMKCEKLRSSLTSSTSCGSATQMIPLVILMQGLPGMGKSFIAKNIVEDLRKTGISAADVAQDDFVEKFGQKKSGSACLAAIRSIILEKETSVIIVARNNSSKSQYAKYLDLDDDGSCRCIFLSPAELAINSAESLRIQIIGKKRFTELYPRLSEVLYLSMCSVMYRKSKEKEFKHPTNAMDENGLLHLPLFFLQELIVRNGGCHSNPAPTLYYPLLPPQEIPIPNTADSAPLLMPFNEWVERRLESTKKLSYKHGWTEIASDSSDKIEKIEKTDTEEKTSTLLSSLRLDDEDHISSICQNGRNNLDSAVENELSLDHSVSFIKLLLREHLVPEIPLSSTYFSLVFPTEEQLKLLSLFDDLPGASDTKNKVEFFPSSFTISCDHVTLVHSNSYFKGYPQVNTSTNEGGDNSAVTWRGQTIWEKMKKNIGNHVSINVISIVYIPNVVAVAEVSLSAAKSKTPEEKNEIVDEDCGLYFSMNADDHIADWNEVVISGIPHITIAHNHEVRAAHSAHYLAEAQSQLAALALEPVIGKWTLIQSNSDDALFDIYYRKLECDTFVFDGVVSLS